MCCFVYRSTRLTSPRIPKRIERNRSVRRREEPRLVYVSESARFSELWRRIWGTGTRKDSTIVTPKLFNTSARFSPTWSVNFTIPETMNRKTHSKTFNFRLLLFTIGKKRRSGVARGKASAAQRSQMGARGESRSRGKRTTF